MFAGWVRVRTRSDPKGRSTKQLALAPTYTGPGQQYLARTLGRPCGDRGQSNRWLAKCDLMTKTGYGYAKCLTVAGTATTAQTMALITTMTRVTTTKPATSNTSRCSSCSNGGHI